MPHPRHASSGRRGRTRRTAAARLPDRWRRDWSARTRTRGRAVGPAKVTARGCGIHSSPHGDDPPAMRSRRAGSSTSTSHSAAEPRAPAALSSTRVPRTSSMTTFAVASIPSGVAVAVGADDDHLIVAVRSHRDDAAVVQHARTSADPAPRAGRRCRRRRARWARGAVGGETQPPEVPAAGRVVGCTRRSSSPVHTGWSGALPSPPATVVHSATMPSSRRPTRSSVVSHGMFGVIPRDPGEVGTVGGQRGLGEEVAVLGQRQHRRRIPHGRAVERHLDDVAVRRPATRCASRGWRAGARPAR